MSKFYFKNHSSKNSKIYLYKINFVKVMDVEIYLNLISRALTIWIMQFRLGSSSVLLDLDSIQTVDKPIENQGYGGTTY